MFNCNMTLWPPMTPWHHLKFRASFCHLFWHGKQSQSNLIKFPSKISHLTYAFPEQVWFAIRFAQSPRLFTNMTSLWSAWVFFDSNFLLRLLYLQSQERFQRHLMVPTWPNKNTWPFPWPQPTLTSQPTHSEFKIESIRNQPTRARHHVNIRIFWPFDPDM